MGWAPLGCIRLGTGLDCIGCGYITGEGVIIGEAYGYAGRMPPCGGGAMAYGY